MTSDHGHLQYLMYDFVFLGLNTPFIDPPFKLGVYLHIGYLALTYPIQQLRGW